MCRDFFENQEADFFVYPAVNYYKERVFECLKRSKDLIKTEKTRVYVNDKIEIEEILTFFNDLESEYMFRWYLMENAEKIKRAYESYKNIFLQDAQRYKNLDYFLYGIDD